MLFPALLDAGKDRTLRGGPLTVYVYLLGTLDVQTYRTVKVWAISHVLGIKEHTAGLALRTLVERGYLDAGPMRNNGNHRQPREYRLVWSRPTPSHADDVAVSCALSSDRSAEHPQTDITQDDAA